MTGSVGKTTTKEMISAVLEKKYRVVKTQGNWNSQIGVAMMMFELEPETELAIFEMGMSLPGEMARLVEIAKPQTAVMTNIGCPISEILAAVKILPRRKDILSNMSELPTMANCIFAEMAT